MNRSYLIAGIVFGATALSAAQASADTGFGHGWGGASYYDRTWEGEGRYGGPGNHWGRRNWGSHHGYRVATPGCRDITIRKEDGYGGVIVKRIHRC